MAYQAITLEKLKQTNSGIHVKVEAMPLSGTSDGNGSFICSLARFGQIVPATVSEVVHNQFEMFPGVYDVTGKWNGEQLDVHDAEMTGELSIEERKQPEPRVMYSDDVVPLSYMAHLRKKEFRFR